MNNSDKTLAHGGRYFTGDHLKSNLKKRAVRGAGATIFSRISAHCIQTIGTIVLARLLAPDDFGLVAMIAVFSMLFQNFGMRGFTEAIIQSEEINHKQISNLFWIHVLLSVVLAIFFIALSPLMTWFYQDTRVRSIAIPITLTFVFSALSAQHLALLKRDFQFYKIAANEIASTFFSIVVAITLALQGWGYWALVARRVSLPMCSAAGAWILCRWFPGLPSFNTGDRSMIKFAMNTYGNFVTNYLSRNLDKILIGWRYGTQSLGNYEKAYYLFVMPVNQLSYPLTSVAVATLSRLRDDPEKCIRYYLQSISVIAFVGMPLSAVLTIIGKDFLLLLLGPQWKEAGEMFAVFGPCVGILLVYGTHGWLHLSLGRADRWFRWGIFELALTALAFVVGLGFGALGVAVAYTICFYVLFLPGLWYAGKPINLTLSSIVSVQWRFFMSSLAAGLMTWYVLYSVNVTSKIFIDLNIVARILVPCILCVFIYVLLVLALYPGKKSISQFVMLLKNTFPNVFVKKFGSSD